MKNTQHQSAIEPVSNLRNELQGAQYLAVAVGTLRKSRHTGTLLGHPTPRYLKIGRTVRYRQEDLDEWLNQFTTVGNTSEFDLRAA